MILLCSLQVGDASSSSSPLSFGGFGSMLRHLPRLAEGINDALERDQLSQRSLALLQVRSWLIGLLQANSKSALARPWSC